MKKMVIVFGLTALFVIWWYAAAPREEIRCCVSGSIVFDPSVIQATDAVDQSEKFAAELEMLPLNLPAYDDAVFIDNGKKALVTAHDGRIWEVDFAANAAQPFVDVPLMAWGIHEAPEIQHRYIFVLLVPMKTDQKVRWLDYIVSISVRAPSCH